MRALFVQNFGAKISAKIARVKCWWNWHLVTYVQVKGWQIVHSCRSFPKIVWLLFTTMLRFDATLIQGLELRPCERQNFPNFGISWNSKHVFFRIPYSVFPYRVKIVFCKRQNIIRNMWNPYFWPKNPVCVKIESLVSQKNHSDLNIQVWVWYAGPYLCRIAFLLCDVNVFYFKMVVLYINSQ